MQRVPLIAEVFGNDMIFPAIVVVVLASSALAFFIAIIRKMPERGFLALFIYLVFLGFLYHSHYLPALDRSQKSIHPIVGEIGRINRNAAVYMYGFNSPALIFYLGRPVGIVKHPSQVPAEKDDMILIAVDKNNRADPFKEMFPFWKRVKYNKDNFLIFSVKNGE
jgi:hypothetical protein